MQPEMGPMGAVVPYWKCAAGHEVADQAEALVAQCRPSDSSRARRAGPACTRCGGWLEPLERVVYPQLARYDELVVDGVYFVTHDYHDAAPFNGGLFRIVGLPAWELGDRTIEVVAQNGR